LIAGDLAHYRHQQAQPLPGTAAVAMQQGNYLARLLQQRLAGQPTQPFQYKDGGSMAVIGRNSAVANLNFIKLSGFPAWFIWIFVHIYYLIEFDNKLIVMLQWAWYYFTHHRSARLITGDDSIPALSNQVLSDMEMETEFVAVDGEVLKT
jgi:NADH dehydrogenase